MVVSTTLKHGLPLLVLLFLSQLGQAQSDSEKSWLARTEVRRYPDYFEKITFNGKHQEYYTVDTYLKDSSLYRTDNYKLFVASNMYRFENDSGKILVRQGPTKILYHDGQTYLSALYKENQLNGPFMVFYSDGSIKRKELYKRGNRKESHCFTPDGLEQPCTVFYQGPQFTGDQQGLKTYLITRLQPIVNGQPIQYMKIQLTINEIGQISHTAVVANQSNPMLAAMVDQIIRNMPHWNPVATDWKPATMDGVPLSETWTISVYRRAGFLYVSFS